MATKKRAKATAKKVARKKLARKAAKKAPARKKVRVRKPDPRPEVGAMNVREASEEAEGPGASPVPVTGRTASADPVVMKGPAGYQPQELETVVEHDKDHDHEVETVKSPTKDKPVPQGDMGKDTPSSQSGTEGKTQQDPITEKAYDPTWVDRAIPSKQQSRDPFLDAAKAHATAGRYDAMTAQEEEDHPSSSMMFWIVVAIFAGMVGLGVWAALFKG